MSAFPYRVQSGRSIVVSWRLGDRVRTFDGPHNAAPVEVDARDPSLITGLARHLREAGAQLVAIHDSRPYLDRSGQPTGLREGEVADALDVFPARPVLDVLTEQHAEAAAAATAHQRKRARKAISEHWDARDAAEEQERIDDLTASAVRGGAR